MSRKHRDKGRIGGQFVPLLHATLDTPAWKAMSHGAKSLYVALKRRVPRGRNIAYVSYRLAERELKSSRRKIREWFAELAHFGFIRQWDESKLQKQNPGEDVGNAVVRTWETSLVRTWSP
jgi:hypothetical protein